MAHPRRDQDGRQCRLVAHADALPVCRYVDGERTLLGVFVVLDSVLNQHLKGGRRQIPLHLAHLVGNPHLNALAESLLQQGKITVQEL